MANALNKNFQQLASFKMLETQFGNHVSEVSNSGNKERKQETQIQQNALGLIIDQEVLIKILKEDYELIIFYYLKVCKTSI